MALRKQAPNRLACGPDHSDSQVNLGQGLGNSTVSSSALGTARTWRGLGGEQRYLRPGHQISWRLSLQGPRSAAGILEQDAPEKFESQDLATQSWGVNWQDFMRKLRVTAENLCQDTSGGCLGHFRAGHRRFDSALGHWAAQTCRSCPSPEVFVYAVWALEVGVRHRSWSAGDASGGATVVCARRRGRTLHATTRAGHYYLKQFGPQLQVELWGQVRGVGAMVHEHLRRPGEEIATSSSRMRDAVTQVISWDDAGKQICDI